MNAKPTIDPSDNRRRVCTPEEQREFARLGRVLLAADVSLDEIRKALGYDEVEGVQRALDVARVTTDSLERLRELTRERIGEAALEPPSSTSNGGGRGGSASPGRATRTWVPPAATPGVTAAPRPAPEPTRAPTELTRAQQRRLRDTLDHLMASDARLRDPSLLARAAGLASGDELQRAREGGATPRTLENVDTFARMHAAFSSRATLALMDGIAIADLKEYLISRSRAERGAGSPNDSRDEEAGMTEAQESIAVTDGAGEREDVKSAAPSNGSGEGGKSSKRGPYRSRGRSKVHLTAAQHAELRQTVEGLWSRDGRLRSWTLLARAGGLGTGPAMKRAYEVNSSQTTLRNLSAFASLHERHGRAAVDALKAGVPVEELRTHLEREGTPESGRNGQAGGAPRRSVTAAVPAAAAPSGTSAPARAASAAPAGELTGALQLAAEIDAELPHLRRALGLFGRLAEDRALPRFLRESAGAARDHLQAVVATFSAEDEQG